MYEMPTAVAIARQQEYDEAAARICELAGNINAAQAEMAKLVADFDARELWSGYGIRTCQHWMTINTGVNEHTATELLRVGHALETLPQLRDAFESGQLSLDKVRMVTRVAAAADEEFWLYVARYASGAQLAASSVATSSAALTTARPTSVAPAAGSGPPGAPTACSSCAPSCCPRTAPSSSQPSTPSPIAPGRPSRHRARCSTAVAA
jgi:hypothetical protein